MWTWGPLAYLLVPFHIGNNLLCGLILQSILWILLGLAFWDVSAHSEIEAAALATLRLLFLLSSKGGAITDYPGAARAMIGARVLSVLAKIFHYRSLVAWLDESATQNAAAVGLPPEMKALVGRSSIAYVSHLFSNALGEDMNLELLPVPQNFSAFTPYLDGRNAEWISSHGPQYLVFEFASIDDRHPLTEAPATWAAIYRWYETMATGRQYILLERRKEPRFERFETLQSRSIQFGEAVFSE